MYNNTLIGCHSSATLPVKKLAWPEKDEDEVSAALVETLEFSI